MHSCCVICAVTVRVQMWRAAGVSVYTPVDCQGIQISGKRKSISELEKITTVQSRMRIAKNSTFVRLPIVVLFPLR